MAVPSRVSLVTLGVTDVAAARRFYEALGWEASSASVDNEVAFFPTAGAVLALYGRQALAAEAALPAEPRAPFEGVALAINVERAELVAAVLNEAVAAGGTVLTPAHRADWGGTSGYFADPDGHAWEVAYNPFWDLTDDGRVILP